MKKPLPELLYHQTPFIYRGEEMYTQCLCVEKHNTGSNLSGSSQDKWTNTQVFGLDDTACNLILADS